MSKSTAATRILAEELFRYREARDEAIDKGDSTMAKAFQNDIYEIEDALYKLGWYDEQKHLSGEDISIGHADSEKIVQDVLNELTEEQTNVVDYLINDVYYSDILKKKKEEEDNE